MKNKLLLLLLAILLIFLALNQKNKNKTTTSENELQDFCFSLQKGVGIGMKKITTTPQQFLENNPQVIAAINGLYWGADDGLPQGLAYLTPNQHLSTGKGRISAYLTINLNGQVEVSDSFDNNYSKYLMVIGTHPLLIKDKTINTQAQEQRYNNFPAFRSAIGSKNGRDICFTVSTKTITIQDWAKILLANDYTQAVNLDGGPVSQLAIRGRGVFGLGQSPTRLIIYAYKK